MLRHAARRGAGWLSPAAREHCGDAAGEPIAGSVASATYFVSHATLVRGGDPGMSKWRKMLFLALSRTSTSPVEY